MIDDSQIYQMIQTALKMRERSYCPYSHYAVGTALLTKDGQIFGGCNIENIAFGPSNCAERTSFFKAISDGHKEFVGIAIAGGPAGKEPLEYCTPCGVCRQVMAEFCHEDFSIIMEKQTATIKSRLWANCCQTVFLRMDKLVFKAKKSPKKKKKNSKKKTCPKRKCLFLDKSNFIPIILV